MFQVAKGQSCFQLFVVAHPGAAALDPQFQQHIQPLSMFAIEMRPADRLAQANPPGSNNSNAGSSSRREIDRHILFADELIRHQHPAYPVSIGNLCLMSCCQRNSPGAGLFNCIANKLAPSWFCHEAQAAHRTWR